MDNDEVTWLFHVASVLLRYPEIDESVYLDRLAYLRKKTAGQQETKGREWILNTLDDWQQIPFITLCENYVEAFDFSEGSCLYLTAHEYGDGRARGEALVMLHNMYAVAGWQEATTELSDYLPLILEFLSLYGNDPQTTLLQLRLAKVTHRILAHLPSRNVFRGVFHALLTVLPTVELKDESIVFPFRESADTDELPYPLQHQFS